MDMHDTEKHKWQVLGDILEALAGAIFVDADFNSDLVWKIFRPLLQPMISGAEAQLHPVRELLELCQKMYFPCHKSFACLEGGSVQCRYIFQVHVADKVVSGVATAKDKKSAKRQAALCALAKLKAMGYSRPCKSKPSVGTSKMKQEVMLSMPPDVGVGTYTMTKNEQDVATIPCCRDAAADEKAVASVSRGCSTGETTAYTRGETSTASTSGQVTAPTTLANHSTSSSVWERAHGSNEREGGGDTQVSSSRALSASGRVGPADQEPACHFTLARDSSITRSCSDVGDPSSKFRHLCLTELAVQASSSGKARTALHEACARKRWTAPSFRRSYEEGPPHEKWFTYDVILQLPEVGQVECRGDPQRTAKAAMDSAATELLHWLADQGFS